MNDADERRKRQDAMGANAFRRAADALDETRARLRQTGAELRERERELDRTGHLVRAVERSTRELSSANSRQGGAAPAPERDVNDEPPAEQVNGEQ